MLYGWLWTLRTDSAQCPVLTGNDAYRSPPSSPKSFTKQPETATLLSPPPALPHLSLFLSVSTYSPHRHDYLLVYEIFSLVFLNTPFSQKFSIEIDPESQQPSHIRSYRCDPSMASCTLPATESKPSRFTSKFYCFLALQPKESFLTYMYFRFLICPMGIEYFSQRLSCSNAL